MPTTDARTLLRDGHTVRVMIDVRHPGVRIPPLPLTSPMLCLEWGTGLVPHIDEFKVTGAGVSGWLVFGGVPFHCTVPWSSVVAAECASVRVAVPHERHLVLLPPVPHTAR